MIDLMEVEPISSEGSEPVFRLTAVIVFRTMVDLIR
jgi:hypothetical protein